MLRFGAVQQKMRVKRLKNNEYIKEEGIWVRNPYCPGKPFDVNSLAKGDSDVFLKNEMENTRRPHLQMDEFRELAADKVVIVSDGYNWARNQFYLGGLPNKAIRVIGVNGSLSRWEMVGDSAKIKRTMSFYVANNPYPECMGYLPRSHRYYPNIVASARTYPGFLAAYKNQPYLYRPTNDFDYAGFGGSEISMILDDYRNPICAALSLTVRMGAKKIVLLCCDESFEEDRPGSVKMENGLFQYPQQIKCQKVIDKQIFWLRKNGVEVRDCSSGVKLNNAEYINPEGLVDFFEKD